MSNQQVEIRSMVDGIVVNVVLAQVVKHPLRDVLMEPYVLLDVTRRQFDNLADAFSLHCGLEMVEYVE